MNIDTSTMSMLSIIFLYILPQSLLMCYGYNKKSEVLMLLSVVPVVNIMVGLTLLIFRLIDSGLKVGDIS